MYHYSLNKLKFDFTVFEGIIKPGVWLVVFSVPQMVVSVFPPLILKNNVIIWVFFFKSTSAFG